MVVSTGKQGTPFSLASTQGSFLCSSILSTTRSTEPLTGRGEAMVAPERGLGEGLGLGLGDGGPAGMAASVENATHTSTAARDHRGSGIIVVSSRGRRRRGRAALLVHCAIGTGHLVKMAGKAYSLDARGGAMASTRSITVAALALALGGAAARAEGRRDVPYVAPSPAAVQQMIELARLRAGDVVYDLGCGDGRIVIAAVKVPDVRGVCVEIDPALVRLGREEAEKAGVASKITFVQGDIFEVPIEDATV